MINRTLVRTKVVQTLFAHYSGSDHTALSARKTLLNKFSSTYSLYMMMLSFADELTTYAENKSLKIKSVQPYFIKITKLIATLSTTA